MSAVETASPHLRVSAAKASSTAEAPSARIPPPEPSSVEDKFFWTYTEEPHRSRRQAIIKAHPEVCPCFYLIPQEHAPPSWFPGLFRVPKLRVPGKYTDIPELVTDFYAWYQVTKLCGPEPLTKYVVLGVVTLQLTCAYLLRNTSMLDWKFLATAYVIGATSNQNLFLAIHEISHNLAFRSPMGNRLLAIFANLPIGLPYSAAFRVSLLAPSNRPPYTAESKTGVN